MPHPQQSWPNDPWLQALNLKSFIAEILLLQFLHGCLPIARRSSDTGSSVLGDKKKCWLLCHKKQKGVQVLAGLVESACSLVMVLVMEVGLC